VYVANGHIFIYREDGAEEGRIDVPERPLQLLFGGTDGRTLFILTHRALYATRVPLPQISQQQPRPSKQMPGLGDL
jgi:sugar lactone lactonase YvrE